MEITIKAEGLSKSYGDIKALKDVSISVCRGEVFGLLGSNGAGKSTTVECMLATKKPDSGKVSILGFDPQRERQRLFEKVGVQFQESNYQDKIRVGEICQVTHSLYGNPSDYLDLLRQFELNDKINNQVSELSGGQKQRLFIVLALIVNPEVVFLDELTTGLDLKARRDVWKALSELKKQGLTVFLTSHYMDEVQALCDRIAILKKGEIIYNGTVSQAIENSPYDKFEDAYLWYTGEEANRNESL